MLFEPAQHHDVTSQLRRRRSALAFFKLFVFAELSQVLHGCVVITKTLIQRSEREIAEWRRIRHQLEQTLALFDHFSDLEAVPATLFLAEDRIGGDVELEHPFDLAHLRAARDEPDHK